MKSMKPKKINTIQDYFSIEKRDKQRKQNGKKISKWVNVYLITIKTDELPHILKEISEKFEKCYEININKEMIEKNLCLNSYGFDINIKSMILDYPKEYPKIECIKIGKVRTEFSTEFKNIFDQTFKKNSFSCPLKNCTKDQNSCNPIFFEFNKITFSSMEQFFTKYNKLRKWVQIDVKLMQTYVDKNYSVFFHIDYIKTYGSEIHMWHNKSFRPIPDIYQSKIHHGCLDCMCCTKYHEEKIIFDNTNLDEKILEYDPFLPEFYYIQVKCRNLNRYKYCIINKNAIKAIPIIDEDKESPYGCQKYKQNICMNCKSIIENGKRECSTCGFHNLDKDFLQLILSIFSFIVSIFSFIVSFILLF